MSETSARTPRTPFFHSFPRISLKANPFPAALRFAVAVANIGTRRNPELMHDCVPDHCAKLVSRQRPPTALVAKLNISGVAVCNRELFLSVARYALTDKDGVALAFQEQIIDHLLLCCG